MLPRRWIKLTERHVDGGLSGTGLLHNVVDGPVEPVKNGGSGRRLALEDLDGEKLGLLRDTIGLATNGTGNVGSVADAVNVLASNSVVGKFSTAFKFLVLGVDTSVNDVAEGTLASLVVVDVAGAGIALVRDSTQTPGSTFLSGQSVEVPNLVLLNVSNLEVC